jgi:tetratricopeptide (TPR) repeat protein
MMVLLADLLFRRLRLWLLLLGLLPGAGQAQTPDFSAVNAPWFEVQTAHFQVYSCGTPQLVYKLTGRLEQFCKAYAQMAGAQAVASPPIVVLAFPDHERLKPFLPLYQGRPANLAGFFKRGEDENLIVLALPSDAEGGGDMTVIFHEYTHLLFRHNDQFWPLWLKEGMAEAYSTFATGGRVVSLAGPIAHHLELLEQTPLMPLADLFAVGHDSPQYNESSRQGLFYAESWLLTQFLLAGDRPALRARFGGYTDRLRAGENAVAAFTNALGVSLPAMEAQLRRYRANGQFPPLELKLSADLSKPIDVTTRALTPVEIYFRLGDELLRIDRLDTAGDFFKRAQTLAPAGPLPYEGLGLLAMQRNQPAEALRELTTALQQGSTSFLAYYIYARERYRLTARGGESYGPLKDAAAADIRDHLEKSLALMPDYAPAQELLGFFEMVQGDQPVDAELHLRRAIQLEPENPSYLYSLAQFQFKNQQPAAAQATLEPLLKPNIEAPLRLQAQELIRENTR